MASLSAGNTATSCVVGPLRADRSIEPFWRIAVQREDRARGSAFIHASFREGTRVQVSQPIGTFRLSREDRPVLLVAGGVGITPILSMMRSLELRRRPFSMFYAGQSRDQMAFVDEVEAIGGDRVTIHENIRDGIPDLRALLEGQPADTVVYVCGPGPMIDALTDTAAGLGWSPDRIRFEVFNVAHKPADEGIEVELKDGRVIHVGAGTTILDALVHYEVGKFKGGAQWFPELFKYDTQENQFEIAYMSKIKNIKLFKNGRVDIKFRSAAFVQEFVEQYLRRNPA